MNLRTATPLLAVLTVLVAGCSGSSDKPQTLPSITATPTAVATAPVIPAAAKPKTPAGADAFVRFFFDQMNVAFSKSDASIIERLQNGECATCNNYQAALLDALAQGHFIQGKSFEITDVAAAPLEALGARVEVFGSAPARKLVDHQGATLSVLPAKSGFHLVVFVKPGPSGWLVSAITTGTP